jgi:hypothetical protein
MTDPKMALKEKLGAWEKIDAEQREMLSKSLNLRAEIDKEIATSILKEVLSSNAKWEYFSRNSCSFLSCEQEFKHWNEFMDSWKSIQCALISLGNYPDVILRYDDGVITIQCENSKLAADFAKQNNLKVISKSALKHREELKKDLEGIEELITVFNLE